MTIELLRRKFLYAAATLEYQLLTIFIARWHKLLWKLDAWCSWFERPRKRIKGPAYLQLILFLVLSLLYFLCFEISGLCFKFAFVVQRRRALLRVTLSVAELADGK